jgi:membrane protein implicated in regulation of membrane protease activity
MKPQKLLSRSFRLIMMIHLIAFTAIGLFSTKGWGLLILFLSILAPSIALVWLLRLYLERHPGKKGIRGFLSKIYDALLSTRR